MRTINFSEARSNLKGVLDAVASDHKVTIVTRRDSEDAVIMSLSDYNSLQETLYLLGNQVNAERLHAAMAEADATLPAGARILGPSTEKANVSGGVIKRQAFQGPGLRQKVRPVAGKMPSFVESLVSGKTTHETGSKAPARGKATAKPRRKA